VEFRVIAREPVRLLLRPPVLDGVDRERYRCFVSMNARYRPRPSMWVEDYEVFPGELSVNYFNVMGRLRDPGLRDVALHVLRRAGVKSNPYSGASCVGFFASSMEALLSVLGLLRDYVEEAAIVSSAWRMKIRRYVNLKRLVEAGFVPEATPRIKAVTGVVNGYTVRVFFTGAIMAYGPLVREDAERLAGNIYAILRRSRALV